MLIQQGAPVRIWGKAAPGETVSVTFAGSQRYSVKANAAGKWQVFLTPVKAGGPHEMVIAGTNRIIVKDILAGEVWIGSGQSNMEFPMARVMNAAEEIPKASFPQIRLFTVKRLVAEDPLEDVQGSWAACTPETVKNFSAVAYFFGREIHQTRHVPVGLIHSSWGGTPAESWTEMSFMENDPALTNVLTAWQKTLADYPAKKQAWDDRMAKWSTEEAAAKAAGKPVMNKPAAPPGPGHQNTPAGLYNAMIAPLTPYAIRGALWYQGESNAGEGRAYQYRRLFASMIESWRKQWGEGPFPFYFVQLANYKTNGWWPVLRESQTATLELRNTAMASAIDVGNPTDIHPTNKQDVGHRLALAARADVYGEHIEASGPIFREMAVNGAAAYLYFDHVGTGLEAKGGKLSNFWIAGPDQKFVPAEARIEGNTVMVTALAVGEPVAVRYAWQDDPPVSLYNKEGLPASPFRTDDWAEMKAFGK
jgi:sialate O-acetylesterase